MTTQWYEIWADDSTDPPYILMVVPSVDGFNVLDPREGNRKIFEASSYEDVKLWLLEDEYVQVMGRMALYNE